MNRLLRMCVGGLPLLATLLASAQEIYVCIDSKGRKITSDRPIGECLDREQKVMGTGGTVKRVVGPNLTAREAVAQEEAQKREAEEQARQIEERRRDRALLMRYPNQATHDRERAEALAQVDEVIRASQANLKDLAQQHADLEREMEFYKKDPSKAPGRLKRRVQENADNTSAQQRFLTAQDEEKKRINQRFDEELAKLRPRWAQQAAVAPPVASAPKGK